MAPDFSFIQLQPARIPLAYKLIVALAGVAGFCWGLFA